MVAVDIVILSYNTLELLQALCADLDRTAPQANQLIVDNGSTDGSAEWLAEKGRGAHFNEHNEGFSRACNQGAALGTAEIICFLNSDLQLVDGWLEGVLAAFEDPQVMIAGTRLVKPNGEPQMFDFVAGACLAVRRWWFEEVGGFDELYFFGMEDVDLTWQAIRDGYRMVQTEPAIVHLCGASHTDESAEQVRVARAQFKDKWNMDKVLRYVGQRGCFLIGVPSRDLTPGDLVILAGQGHTKAQLVTSGLYEEIKPARKRASKRSSRRAEETEE